MEVICAILGVDINGAFQIRIQISKCRFGYLCAASSPTSLRMLQSRRRRGRRQMIGRAGEAGRAAGKPWIEAGLIFGSVRKRQRRRKK
jgi:hypothetical protein